MKNKYQRMSKEEKKALQEKFYKTEKGKDMKKRLLRLRMIGFIGMLFAAFLVVSAYFSKELNWATWLMSIILMACSVTYFVSSFVLKGKVLNDFAIKNIK